MKTMYVAATIVAIGMIALTASASARAGDRGVALGLSTSYGVPLGTAADGIAFNKLTSGAVPVQLDLSYRFDRRWQAGVYFTYGVAMVANEAKDALTASGLRDIGSHREQRVGLQGTYTIAPDSRVAPWVGVGFGYSWTRYAAATTAAGKDTELGLGGLEGNLQLGGNYKLSPRWTAGPFASVSVGQFRSYVTWVDGSKETSVNVNDKAIHEWVQFGLRTTFTP